ncbi:MAG: hypothetical protein GY896_09140 [Gammaproteobacteria bacterium]|nr:hypothetical protein [Gammaproteobacteria bacterium]
MSDQLFEVAFSGQISEGANAQEVKARVGKIFNADDAKLAQLFSGKRIVIKKNVDQATAAKYKTALNHAGAECEISLLGAESAVAPALAPVEAASEPAVAAEPTASSPPTSAEFESNYDGDVTPAPQTDPLGITGDQIEDLAVSIAPVGSELQDDYGEVAEPEIDITGFDIAPVGSELSTAKKKHDPPPPDITGITLAD